MTRYGLILKSEIAGQIVCGFIGTGTGAKHFASDAFM